MQTVVELPGYRKRAVSLLRESEREGIIHLLAEMPKSGELIRETGGVRKLRWKRGDSGKSGGVRVIYFYYNKGLPLFLLTLYSKGEQDNLTRAQRHEMRKVTERLVREWEKRYE